MTQTCVFVHTVFISLAKRVDISCPFSETENMLQKTHLCTHASASVFQLSKYVLAGCLFTDHTMREGLVVELLKVVWFLFFPPSLPVSNQDKSSASEEVLPF